jgi:molybdate transport system substrate-binding protein
MNSRDRREDDIKSMTGHPEKAGRATIMKARLIFAIAASLFLPGMATAAEIKLIASAALKAAYLELLPQFEMATGHKVTAVWSSSQVIQKRIAAGEDADLIIMANILGKSLTEELIEQGKLTASSRAIFATSGIGVAVRAGAPKPDISSADAVKKSILAAQSIAYSAGASGTYLVSMVEKLGIYDQVTSKVAAVKPSEPVGEVVARGDAEIGFHQVSELLPVKDIDIVGQLPPELQNITEYSGGIHSGTKDAAAAAALAKFLTAPPTTPTLKKHGLEPG